MNYQVQVKTNTGRAVTFEKILIQDGNYVNEGIILNLGIVDEKVKVTVKPENISETITQIIHRVTIGLRNFHTVIYPDSGRNYTQMMQLVDFWRASRNSSVSNVCIPLYIFNGQDHNTAFAFGIIGRDYETSFRTIEPRGERALMASFRRLTIDISRGYENNPIPIEFSECNVDKSITEYLYIKDYPNGSDVPWVMTLRDFTEQFKRLNDVVFPRSISSMEPLWCSWTDWHSDNVNEQVILEQVEKGVALGIKNYIVDDGWFGPGLDSSWDIELNIGDWDTDPSKIKDIRELSRKIKKLGGRPIIWCAPHAVGSKANCWSERLPYLMRDKEGKLVDTYNHFNLLCLRSPKAREVMADICVRLACEYETDGAKYDLFNCIPDIPCCSHDHTHDTESMIIALESLMALICKKTREVNPEYIIELKQNYGGPWLAQYGTMMRAGDTPYNPEGNFVRTLFIQAYSQYAINDYQTITNHNTPKDSAVMIIKMMAVGVPSYSSDLAVLTQDHLQVLKNYNYWYINNIVPAQNYSRTPLDPGLNIWRFTTDIENFYFMVNQGSVFTLDLSKNFSILNGSASENVFIKGSSDFMFNLRYLSCLGEEIRKEEIKFTGLSSLQVPVGGMVKSECIMHLKNI